MVFKDMGGPCVCGIHHISTAFDGQNDRIKSCMAAYGHCTERVCFVCVLVCVYFCQVHRLLSAAVMSLWIESGQPVPPRNRIEHNETNR